MTVPKEVRDALDASTRILLEVAQERARQIAERGYDVDHDDRHGPAEWAWLIQRRAVDLAHPWDEAHVDRRRELLEIAAIAVAAIQAHDRRDPHGDVR